VSATHMMQSLYTGHDNRMKDRVSLKTYTEDINLIFVLLSINVTFIFLLFLIRRHVSASHGHLQVL
jgi:hypothetical protein